MKSTENNTKTPAKSAARKKTADNKKTSPKPVDTEVKKVLGLESPIWVRNPAGQILCGLKVDKASWGSNEIRIQGWLVGALDEIALRINGENVTATFSRMGRPDVAQALGIKEHAAGFGFQLIASPPSAKTPDDKLSLYWSAGAELGEIALLEENMAQPSRPSSQKAALAEPKYHLDKIEGPYLHGWMAAGGLSVQKIAIKAGDRIIECEVLKKDRKDAAAALGIDAVDLGFQLAIPGYVWEEIPVDAPHHIQLLADGLPLANIAFTRKGVVEWIEKLVEIPQDRKQAGLAADGKEVGLTADGKEVALIKEIELIDDSEKQCLALLALEHVRYGGLSKLLTPRTLGLMQEFAAKMNLVDFLPVGDVASKKLQPAESFAQMLRWKALRILNERLSVADSPNAVFAAVADVMHELDLEDEIKKQYLASVIPTLCRYDIFFRLRELVDLVHWHNYEHVSHASGLTIALPALVIDQKISHATNVLWKLSEHLDRGWINIECIYFSVKEFNRQFLSGQIECAQAEKFGYAIIGILDGFRGQWFSRLHDYELIQSAVALLDVFNAHSDHFRRDLIRALIRNYALVPEFWRILADAHPDFRNVELNRARAYWQHLKEVLDSSQVLHEQLEQLLPSLSYFHTLGNPETTIFLREVLMNSLPQLNGNLTPARQMLIEMLLKDAPEGVRLAAFPLADSNRLQAHFPESSSHLLRTLRELTPRLKSTFYQAQSEAGLLIQQILQVSSDSDALAAGLKALHCYLVILNNGSSQFLSADLQVLIYELGRQAGLAKDSELHAVAGKISKAIAETKPGGFLPAPVQAALARLNRYADDDVMIRAFLADMQQLIQGKFGDSHDFLFELPQTQALTSSGIGFASDTLVVIYSCRKYLDTRVAAIRNTWVQDLIARNIPYLILVGDGDDTIDGDVLALNVSDKYEDLPKKTLKLFDWVLNNTAFQYVYKIDDDCYLEVPRFFDTLSYRKHFYYGRVIHRDIGSMDRAWHQLKSHSLYAQKVLDKSPEPSVYADGGGAYVLSRVAMLKLQEVSQTEAGQHLIAVSLMEDKLVGDLLSMSSIIPSNEDYESYQRRRTFSEAVPVGMWDNLFFPGPNTPTVMTHLDTEHDMQRLHERHSITELWPKKVWPTGSPLYINETHIPGGMTGTNQLELLSVPEQLHMLLGNSLYVVAVVRNEIIMLPHFLEHYRRLGVKCFLMVDNLSDDGSREYLLDQPDVGLFSADTEYKKSHYGVAWQQALLGNFCLNKWVLLADADELLVYPECETLSLPEFIATIEQEGVDCVRTDMVDMYPFGDLDDADLTEHSPFEVAQWFDAAPFVEWRMGKGVFSNSLSLLSALRHRITAITEPSTFTAQKYALLRYKPWMRLSQGIHDLAGGKVATQNAWFAHFKYHAGFKHKVEAEILRGQHFDNAKEYRRYAEILAESKGGFGDENLSACYESSASLSALTGAHQK